MSFKEFKKKDKVKTWESKIRRLYASEEIIDEDLNYLNLQYDLYKGRKSEISILTLFSSLIIYRFPLMSNLSFSKKMLITLGLSYVIYRGLRLKNRLHYETIIMPYFEKYRIR